MSLWRVALFLLLYLLLLELQRCHLQVLFKDSDHLFEFALQSGIVGVETLDVVGLRLLNLR